MDHLKMMERFYETESPEEIRLQPGTPHHLEFLTAARYLDKHLLPGSSILDNCAGTGAYSFYLAGQGHRVTAGDIIPYNVERIKARNEKTALLAGIYCGDAMELSRFKDRSFQAVLCMGALYHVPEPGAANMRRAIAESARLLEPGGLLACTYMGRHAIVLDNCSGSLENIGEVMQFARSGREGIFYASTPAEIGSIMAEAGFAKLCHVALDGLAIFLHQTTKRLDADGLERWAQYHSAVCEEESMLGLSYHNMYIGRLDAAGRDTGNSQTGTASRCGESVSL